MRSCTLVSSWSVEILGKTSAVSSRAVMKEKVKPSIRLTLKPSPAAMLNLYWENSPRGFLGVITITDGSSVSR